MPLEPAQYEAAILRLACDVPCFTEAQIEGWWPPIAESGGKRTIRRGGPNAILKKLVKDGLLSKQQAPTVTIDHHRDCIRWFPGEPQPDFQAAAAYLHKRVAHFQRGTWLLGPQYELSKKPGLIPSAEVLQKHHDPNLAATPKNIVFYRATDVARKADGQPTIDFERMHSIIQTFDSQQPACECHRELKSAWRDDIAINAITRGLAVSSFYLDMIARGRQMDRSTEFADALPVAFERSWQGFGFLQSEVREIVPDAIQFLPDHEMKPIAVAISIWCAHAVEAFHRTCQHLKLGYVLF